MLHIQDEVFYRLSGVMEYDRTLQEQGNYREFLFRTARYREVVPLESAFDPVTQVLLMWCVWCVCIVWCVCACIYSVVLSCGSMCDSHPLYFTFMHPFASCV